MALRKRNISKKKRRWLLSHFQNPWNVTQKDVLKKTEMSQSEFYVKFYQVVIDQQSERYY